jgi:alpha-glucosidase (family GH31 glycosyl hydrolase)
VRRVRACSQGGTQGGCTGLAQNPTIWIDRIRCTDHIRRGENVRGVTLARWGGLGTHRYQVGFSGDVNSLDWADLAFQPYFSLTSANVGYGLWSHDLVGPANNHELHVRWLQWGAYSGIFRTPDRGMSGGGCAVDNPPSCAIVEMWKLPFDPYLRAARLAVRARGALLPMLYTSLRTAFETGVSTLRPMYYEYPGLSLAYAADQTGAFAQYFFAGADMIVAPVVVPMDPSAQMSTTTVWIPPGLWYEEGCGHFHVGGDEGALLTKAYDLREVPVFVRAGAVIARVPLASGGPDVIGHAARQYDALIFDIYPPAGSQANAALSVYEDDGQSVDYLRGVYGYATCSYTRTATAVHLTIQHSGSFAARPASRRYTVRLLMSWPATSVSYNGGTRVPYARWGPARDAPNGGWTWDGVEGALIVELPPLSTAGQITIDIALVQGAPGLLDGFKVTRPPAPCEPRAMRGDD